MLRVIGAGFGRTGTVSLKAALEQIGFSPCYHMTELFRHPEHAPHWRAAAEGRVPDWQAILGGYAAAVDWPTCAFYADLLRAYPEARVVLTVRDPDRWYESVRNTIYDVRHRARGAAVGPTAEHAGLIESIVWEGTFGGRFEDRAHALRVFARHIHDVRERVPPERLLVMDVKEGWAPLCGFLGAEVPSTPFPHLNDTREFLRLVEAHRNHGAEA